MNAIFHLLQKSLVLAEYGAIVHVPHIFLAATDHHDEYIKLSQENINQKLRKIAAYS